MFTHPGSLITHREWLRDLKSCHSSLFRHNWFQSTPLCSFDLNHRACPNAIKRLANAAFPTVLDSTAAGSTVPAPRGGAGRGRPITTVASVNDSDNRQPRLGPCNIPALPVSQLRPAHCHTCHPSGRPGSPDYIQRLPHSQTVHISTPDLQCKSRNRSVVISDGA